MRSGGNILVDCLLEQGVSTAFGVPGESYLDVLDALFSVQNRLRLIGARHESGAAFMAEAYGKLTGVPGICFVTRGPGACNASIGVHTAAQNSSPMILFVGQIARDMRQREAFQEIDYRGFFGGIAKWVTEIDRVDRIPETIARAFATALSGRPGPVVIALPEDMLREQCAAKAAQRVVVPLAVPAATALDDASALLRKALKPLILVGGGGWNDAARADLRTFAEANHLPVAVAFRSQDLIDNSSPSYVGDAGVGTAAYMPELLREADLILAINIRFGETVTDGWSLFDVPRMAATLIHSHASAAEIGKIYQPDVALQCGPAALLQALAQGPVLGDWRDWSRAARASFVAMQRTTNQRGAVNMAEITRWLDRELAEDVIVTNGAGNFSAWPSKFLTYSAPRRLLAPQSGAMGAGLPAAIAARAAHPDRQVVCFAGDGDLQMSLPELGAAMQEGLQPIILLLNNGLYGTIRAHQARNYPGRRLATTIHNPDFVALAQSYGFFAARVTQTAEFAQAFRRAAASGSGGLVELMIDPRDISAFSRIDEGEG